MLGYFRPSIPINLKELEVRGMSGTQTLARLTGVFSQGMCAAATLPQSDQWQGMM
jgi:hypothetical protein